MMEKMCGSKAAMKRYWPGSKPDFVCIEHARDSKKIADAMGFHIDFEPIGESENQICCCTAGFSQDIYI